MATSSEPIKPIEDVRDISAITYGFMASKALFAALDFDLFTRIEGGIAQVPALALGELRGGAGVRGGLHGLTV